MTSRYHSPASKHYIAPEVKEDPRQMVILMLHRAIEAINEGRFLRAQGLIASQVGTLKQLAAAANQGVDPFSPSKPLKAPRVRSNAARGGRPSTMRVPLAELLHARDLLHPEDAYGATVAGRWPPSKETD